MELKRERERERKRETSAPSITTSRNEDNDTDAADDDDGLISGVVFRWSAPTVELIRVFFFLSFFYRIGFGLISPVSL